MKLLFITIFLFRIDPEYIKCDLGLFGDEMVDDYLDKSLNIFHVNF